MTTHTERDEAAQTWAETTRPSRRELAEDRGYTPDPFDRPRRMDDDDPWRSALEASAAQARQFRGHA